MNSGPGSPTTIDIRVLTLEGYIITFLDNNDGGATCQVCTFLVSSTLVVNSILVVKCTYNLQSGPAVRYYIASHQC